MNNQEFNKYLIFEGIDCVGFVVLRKEVSFDEKKRLLSHFEHDASKGRILDRFTLEKEPELTVTFVEEKKSSFLDKIRNKLVDNSIKV